MKPEDCAKDCNGPDCEGCKDFISIRTVKEFYDELRKMINNVEEAERNERLKVLEEYNTWLLKEGYTDTDIIHELDINDFLNEYLKPGKETGTRAGRSGDYPEYKTQREIAIEHILRYSIEQEAKYSLQYVDYADNQWTVPVLLTKERADQFSDLSIKRIRIEFKS